MASGLGQRIADARQSAARCGASQHARRSPRRPPPQRELQSKGVGKDAEWAAVLRRPLFAGASDGGSASLGHLLDLWVERQHLLWKVGFML